MAERGFRRGWGSLSTYLKKAFINPEIKSYCDKIMLHVKSKKHTDPKFKGDLEMKMYKVLRTHAEGQRDENTKANKMTWMQRWSRGPMPQSWGSSRSPRQSKRKKRNNKD